MGIILPLTWRNNTLLNGYLLWDFVTTVQNIFPASILSGESITVCADSGRGGGVQIEINRQSWGLSLQLN